MRIHWSWLATSVALSVVSIVLLSIAALVPCGADSGLAAGVALALLGGWVAGASAILALALGALFGAGARPELTADLQRRSES